MLDAVGVDVRVRGARPLLSGPVLLVANHVSWIDIQALGAVAGTRFVAKSGGARLADRRRDGGTARDDLPAAWQSLRRHAGEERCSPSSS
mgnify:CR=1 FL=1